MDSEFELIISKLRGEGVVTNRSIRIGEIVIIGTIEKRLGKNHAHASQVGRNDYVLHGGLMSKVNHSCDPNCGIRTNETGAHDLVAMREIKANEELNFDYAMRNYSIDHFPKQCRCGSAICRGKISGWIDLPDERKKTYQGFIAPYLIELDTLLVSN